MTMLSVVIPAYNEESGIAEIANRVLGTKTPLAEVGVVKLVTDGFDHLDGHELVVLPLEIAVIALQQGNAILETGTLSHSTTQKEAASVQHVTIPPR